MIMCAKHFETNIIIIIRILCIYLFVLPLQETTKVHAGANASLRCPLHHLQCYAVHRGVWNPLAHPDAL